MAEEYDEVFAINQSIVSIENFAKEVRNGLQCGGQDRRRHRSSCSEWNGGNWVVLFVWRGYPVLRETLARERRGR